MSSLHWENGETPSDNINYTVSSDYGSMILTSFPNEALKMI